MLVDYKMFVPSAQRLGDGLLFLHEQLPLVTSLLLLLLLFYCYY